MIKSSYWGRRLRSTMEREYSPSSGSIGLENIEMEHGNACFSNLKFVRAVAAILMDRETLFIY